MKSIGYFGIPGSFTYKSAVKYFGNDYLYVSTSTFREIFSKLNDDAIDFGVIPIENTLAGSIYENYDLLDEFNFSISGEVNARVNHSLVIAKDQKSKNTKAEIINQLSKVYSHEKALEQCSNFFKKHKNIKPVAYTSTAHAAKFVAKKRDRKIAAIADKDICKLYDLEVLQTSVENNKYNYTRFLILQKNTHKTKDPNKCSIQIRLPHKTGSLSSILKILSRQNCNLTKIESRSIRTQPFEYVFYIEFLFNNDQDLSAALLKLKNTSIKLKIFGIYKV